MINWRTSRFILMSFLLNASVLAIAVWMMVDQRTIVAFVNSFIPALGSAVREEVSVTPVPERDTGQAVGLPHYPAVQVIPPNVSIFDPAA